MPDSVFGAKNEIVSKCSHGPWLSGHYRQVKDTLRGDNWAETCKINIDSSSFVEIKINDFTGR